MGKCIMCEVDLSGDAQYGICQRCEELRDEIVKKRKERRLLVYIGLGSAVLCLFLSVFIENILVLWWGVLLSLLLAFTSFVGLSDTMEEEIKNKLAERMVKGEE